MKKNKMGVAILTAAIMAMEVPAVAMADSGYTGTYSGVLEVTDTRTVTGGTYTSTTADQSVVLVKGSGALTMDGSTVTKESGDSSNTENSEFYGVNAAVLATAGTTANISNANISTAAKGANAVFATGSGSKIVIKDSTITSTGSSSARGLDATYGGEIEADNVTITTQGGSCASAATDRGEGTVTVKNSNLTTNGAGSPVVYSTGDITLNNTEGTANGAQITVVEGKNSATIENGSKIVASAAGNRGTTDACGIMIYQSMSGDADSGKGTFTASDSTLSIDSGSSYYTSAPMFFITNTDAEINLTNTALNYGSGVLISEMGTSEWGTSGSNGGNLTLNASAQTLKGDLVPDELSTISMNLTDGSYYEGAINTSNSGDVALVLDASSKIKLTADAYVTGVVDSDSTESNIDTNGYTIHIVDAKVDTSSNSGQSSGGAGGNTPGGTPGADMPSGTPGAMDPSGTPGAGMPSGTPGAMDPSATPGATGTVTPGATQAADNDSYTSDANAINIRKAKFSRIATQTYTGSEIKPEITLTYKNKTDKTVSTLTEGTDYRVIYTDNVNVGRAQIVIMGINGYTGSITKTFRIAKKKINDSSITVTVSSNSADGTVAYDAKGAKPQVIVKDTIDGKEVTLVEGTDYKIRYARNKKVGTAYAIVKGMGNYNKSLKAAFVIK